MKVKIGPIELKLYALEDGSFAVANISGREFAALSLWPPPIPMHLFCPACHEQHVDRGEFAKRSHHTHACQRCGMVWRPAVEHTVGVQFLPGFKDPAVEETWRGKPFSKITDEELREAEEYVRNSGALEQDLGRSWTAVLAERKRRAKVGPGGCTCTVCGPAGDHVRCAACCPYSE